MKILITGATGLVGKELVRLLVTHKVEVHYLTTDKAKIQNREGYHGFYWDPSRGIIDKHCLQGVDVIINLAGANISKRWTVAYKQEIVESRILASNLLYKSLKENPNQIKQLISASGTAIYPDKAGKRYTESECVSDGGFLANLVVKWEESIDRFETLGMKVCKLRTGVVFSADGGALPEIIKPIQWGFGAIFGDGKQMMSWIHVKDLAALYYYAALHAWEGVYNAAAPVSIANGELTKVIAKKLKKPLWLPGIPKVMMKLLLGEMHELLFSDKDISPEKAINKGYQFQYPTADLALNDLIKSKNSAF
jgi:uncharacterized protein (TIGR01777 family)